jgi:hypothetical protein
MNVEIWSRVPCCSNASSAVAGPSRLPHAPPLLPWRSVEVGCHGLQHQTLDHITDGPNIELPNQAKTNQKGADSSHIHTHISCACRKCCRPTCFNIPSSLACQHRYVNTTPCLSYPHSAHHQLTPCKDAPTAGFSSLSHVRHLHRHRFGRPLAPYTSLHSPSLTAHHGRTKRRALPDRRAHRRAQAR